MIKKHLKKPNFPEKLTNGILILDKTKTISIPTIYMFQNQKTVKVSKSGARYVNKHIFTQHVIQGYFFTEEDFSIMALTDDFYEIKLVGNTEGYQYEFHDVSIENLKTDFSNRGISSSAKFKASSISKAKLPVKNNLSSQNKSEVPQHESEIHGRNALTDEFWRLLCFIFLIIIFKSKR